MRRLWIGLACLGLVACGAEQARPPSNVIWAQFDPSTGQIPTPNDLVRDPVSGHLNLPITPDLPPADQEFRAYLNGLDAFPTSTPAALHFTADVKPESLDADTVLVWRLDAHGGAPTPVAVAQTYSDVDHGLTLYPSGGWALGTRYAIAIRGGAKGAQGANGETVTAAPAFVFLRAGKDLTQHPWAMPGNTPGERMANAQKLEAVRQQLEPLFQAVVAQGWSRDEIALLFSFTTSSHPAVQFDPLSQAVPLPNDLVIDPSTGLVSIPPDRNDPPAQAKVKSALNTLDGFSTSGPFAAAATAPLDKASATDPSHLRLFELADPPVEVTGVKRYLYPGDQEHFFGLLNSENAQNPAPDDPFTVLEPKTTYFWVVTGMKGSNGVPVEAQPVGALLRLKDSLVANGKSQVSGIADADAARLEPLRAKLAPALDYLEAHGIPRASMAAVVPFTTLDVEGHTRALLEVPYDQSLSLTPVDFTVTGPSQNPLGHVDYVVEGHFETYDMLDPVTTSFGATGVHRPIGFTLTYPKGFDAAHPPKVILFGQALTTERRLAWMEAQRLAQEGFAVFSFDLPYHGERSSCHATLPICKVINGMFATKNPDGTITQGPTLCTDPTSSDQTGAEAAFLCTSGTCGEDGRCVGQGADFNRYPIPLYNGALSANIGNVLESDPAFANLALEPSTPIASGAAFINLEDLGASRDHLRQAEIDFSAAYRFLTQTDWKQMLPGGLDLDTTDVGYTGISLGGILGGVETGAQPKISTFALNVGGAGLPDLFREPGIFGTILPPGLATQGIILDPDPEKVNLPAWQFLTASHWILDDVDPLNIARFALQQRDDYVDVMTGQVMHWPQKRVLVQMAGADTIVTNQSTYRLKSVLDPNCKVCTDPTDESCAKGAQCVFTVFQGDTHIFEVDPLENLNPAQIGAMTDGQDQVARFLSNYK